MTQPVTVYVRQFCSFCERAEALLQSKGIEYERIDAGMDVLKKSEMTKRANGARTFPQIFIGDTHIGGCDDMFELEGAGKLDAMLEGKAA